MGSFLAFAQICQKAAGIGSSLEKVEILAGYLRDLQEADLGIAATFLIGEAIPGQELGVGPSILYDALARAMGCTPGQVADLMRSTGDVGLVAAAAAEKKRPLSLAAFAGSDGLELAEVQGRFMAIARASGRGSQEARVKNLHYLFSEASPLEAQFIARLAMEDMRIGVGEGLARDAIARAFDLDPEEVERGYNLTSDLELVAKRAREGRLAELGVAINRPVKMMLAQIGENIPAALAQGAVAVEWKYDGARVQIHKDGSAIRVFSRRLEDVTASLPEIVQVVRERVWAREAILDGEAVATGGDGRPMPFQDILRRFRRKYDVDRMARSVPLKLNLFDILYLDGEDLLNRTLQERRRLLTKAADQGILADQVVCADQAAVQKIYDEALAAGHEGLMLKNPSSPYAPGKRGKNWLKIKPVMESLDLVVTGARWGEGKRASQLGSFRLGCRDVQTGELLDVGWVATGLSEDLLAELTGILRDLIVKESGMEVEVAPQVVFEVGYEEIQRSPSYSSGYALRFPRLIAVRDDKSPEEADSLERISEIFRIQRGRAGS